MNHKEMGNFVENPTNIIPAKFRSKDSVVSEEKIKM
jgi:hypothetical protein